MAERIGEARPAPFAEGQRAEQREQGAARTGRRGHAGEEVIRVGRLRLLQPDIQRGVEPREPERGADREQQARQEAERPDRLHGPQIEHQRRCHAEGQEIRKAVEFRAEARRGLQQPCQPPVQPVDHGRHDDEGGGLRPPRIDREADRHQPGAKPEHRHDVRDHPVEGQPLEAGAPPETRQGTPRARSLAHRAGTSGGSSAITVSPPIIVWPIETSGVTPSGR